jgi:hypothetical protein
MAAWMVRTSPLANWMLAPSMAGRVRLVNTQAGWV